jgi:lipoprotein signal peptidase
MQSRMEHPLDRGAQEKRTPVPSTGVRARIRSFVVQVVPVATLVILLDQALKGYVRVRFPVCHPPHCPSLVIAGPLRLLREENAGSAMGLIEGWLWPLVAALGIGLVVAYGRRMRLGPLAGLAVGLQLGGSVSNFVDRVAHGSVTDYLYFGHDPVFNLADLAIVVGAVVSTLLLVRAQRMKTPGP